MTNAELLETNDAMVWAKEFVATKNKMGWSLNDIDEGLMVGWFANAMAAQEFQDSLCQACGETPNRCLCACEGYTHS